MAAGVLRALTEQHERGGARLVELALSQTGAWLVDRLARTPDRSSDPYDASRWLTEKDSPMGRLRHVLPAVSYAGGPADWDRPPGIWGTDAPEWR